MLRGAVVLAFASLAIACGEQDDGDDGLTGFGTGPGPTSGAMTSTAADDDGTTVAMTTSTPDDDVGDDDDGGSSTSVPSTDDTTGDPGSDDADTDPPMGTAFGECLGTGAWNTCAQWCSANEATCVENGCDGATVLYFGTVAECTSMQSGDPNSQACDADFTMGGGISFARCCCAF